MYSLPQSLTPKVQNYPWGRTAPDSLVAQLAGITTPGTPCAELWMGAHPSAPSVVRCGNRDVELPRYIAEDPRAVLGDRVFERFSQLPFLFKVLSVGAPLSIQAHPDLTLAKELHARDPKNYPDENHKPEAAIAITPLTLLYGFKPVDTLRQTLEGGSEALQNFFRNAGSTAEELYRHLLCAEGGSLAAATDLHREHLTKVGAQSPEDQWFLRCRNIYGGDDVGLFSIYLMNIASVPVGKAVFINSNIPHAYLDGNLIECMANSDNVVRAGLTPKFQDRETLLTMLRYEVTTPEIRSLVPLSESSPVSVLKVPAAEFKVSRVIPGAPQEIEIDTVQIALQLRGTGTITVNRREQRMNAGDVVLIPASAQKFTVQAAEGGEIYIAAVP